MRQDSNGRRDGGRSDLPLEIPVFPLREAVLLPRGRLPLNIFEPRYLAMVDHALATDRLIGMVRPRHDDFINPPLYHVGCAGRLTSFMETDDGRYLITLSGLSRFRITDEEVDEGGFRRAKVDWSPYPADLTQMSDENVAQRERVLELLVPYLRAVGLNADWDTMEGASAETIVNSVAMSCPFSADEKQLLLEAPDLAARANTLIAMMEIAVHDANANGGEGSPPLQ